MDKKIYLIVLMFLFFSDIFSQKVTDTLQINEILVTTNKIRFNDKSSVPVQSLTQKEIERLTGTNVAEAIKYFSGVSIKDYGGIGGLKTVMVRSLGANHTGVFIDGVQFSDVATGQIDLGKITTDNAGEIALYIGQSNNICQPARYFNSASVICVNSVFPDFSTRKFHVKAAYKTGSFGLINPYVSVQNKIKSVFFSDFNLNYTKANGIYPFQIFQGNSKDTKFYRTNADISSFNFNANLVAKMNDSSKIFFKAYYYYSERGLPGAVVFYNTFSSQRLWNKDFFANIQYKSTENKSFQWLSNIKFLQNQLHYLDPEYLNSDGKLENNYLQSEFYASQVFAYKFANSLSVMWSSDFFVNKLSANLPNYAKPERYTSLNVAKVNFFNNNIDINAYLLNTFVKEQTKIGQAAKPIFKFNGSFSLSCKIFKKPNTRLRLLYKDIFRMPTFNDLYYSMIGNVNLKPESAKQLNFGLVAFSKVVFFDYLSAKLDFYYNHVKDKIVAVPTKNLFVWSMRNIGIVDICGFEFQINVQTKELMKNLKVFATYTYSFQRAIDITSSSSPTFKQQIPYIPLETASVLSTVNYKNFSLNYNALFNGFRYILGENIYENMLPSYWLSDIVAVYNFKLKSIDLKLKFEINNIFNKQYEVIKSFPMPGRYYYLTISTNF